MGCQDGKNIFGILIDSTFIECTSLIRKLSYVDNIPSTKILNTEIEIKILPGGQLDVYR